MDVPITSWRLALRDGDQELAWGDGEFFGNAVDTATLALVDPVGAAATRGPRSTPTRDDKAVYSTISAKQGDTDLIIVPGWSDGSFPCGSGTPTTVHSAVSSSTCSLPS
jgi:hypothetical protein